jgi:hypothetical protein
MQHDTDPDNQEWQRVTRSITWPWGITQTFEYHYTRDEVFFIRNGNTYSLPIGHRPVMRRGPQPFFMRIGFHEGELGPERPSYGWLYKDIRIEFQ